MQFGPTIREGPLSFCQELLLYRELFSGCAPTITRVVRIEGPLDTGAFERAANETIDAHEPLRATWAWRGSKPIALVKCARNLTSAFRLVNSKDVTDLATGIVEALSATAVSASNPPHLRHWIFRRREQDHLWVFIGHHMAIDAMSLKLYADTFRSTYEGASKPVLRTTSIEYAQTLQDWLTTSVAQADLNWWLKKLEQLPRGDLPVASASSGSDVGIERQELRLPLSVRNSLLRRARRERAPSAAIFLAAYALTVEQRRNAESHCVFINVPGRNLTGAACASGASYNSVPLILTTASDTSATIAIAAEALFEVLDHQGVPAPLVSLACVRQGGIALPDRIPVTFNVIDHPLQSFRLPGCRLWEVELATLGPPVWGLSGPLALRSDQVPVRPSMDWLVSVLPTSVVVTVEYATHYADRMDVSAFLAEYEATLHQFCDGLEVGEDTIDAGLVADWTGIA